MIFTHRILKRQIPKRRFFGATLVCLCLAAVAATGCETEPAPQASSSAEETANRVPIAQTFGEEVDRGAAVSVAALRESVARRDGQPVTVEGPIREVCQKKGCWLALGAGEDRPVRVLVPRTESGYGFTVPTDAAGRAVVHGTLRVASLDRSTRDHYAADGAARSDSVELHIDARGIALTHSGR